MENRQKKIDTQAVSGLLAHSETQWTSGSMKKELALMERSNSMQEFVTEKTLR